MAAENSREFQGGTWWKWSEKTYQTTKRDSKDVNPLHGQNPSCTAAFT